MAAAAAPTVVLSFGDARTEVLLSEGLEGLAQRAEGKFELHPKSYGFFDKHGRIETPVALQRAARMASSEGNTLVIEVQEHPEWQRIRHLEARIQQMQPAAVNASAMHEVAQAAAAAMEQQIMERVGMALAELRTDVNCFGGKVGMALAEMKTNLEQVDAKASAAVAVAPLVQRLTMEHIDMKAKLDSMPMDIRAANDDVEVEVAKLQRCADVDMSEQLRNLEEEIKSLRDHANIARHGFKTLQVEVRQLEAQQRSVEEVSTMKDITCGDWTAPAFASPPGSERAASGGVVSACRAEKRMSSLPFSFSKKGSSVWSSTGFGGSAQTPPSPFARAGTVVATSGRQREAAHRHLSGCRSVPQLPSVF
jgi:hypothetical protein